MSADLHAEIASFAAGPLREWSARVERDGVVPAAPDQSVHAGDRPDPGPQAGPPQLTRQQRGGRAIQVRSAAGYPGGDDQVTHAEVRYQSAAHPAHGDRIRREPGQVVPGGGGPARTVPGADDLAMPAKAAP